MHNSAGSIFCISQVGNIYAALPTLLMPELSELPSQVARNPIRDRPGSRRVRAAGSGRHVARLGAGMLRHWRRRTPGSRPVPRRRAAAPARPGHDLSQECRSAHWHDSGRHCGLGPRQRRGYGPRSPCSAAAGGGHGRPRPAGAPAVLRCRTRDGARAWSRRRGTCDPCSCSAAHSNAAATASELE